jgi:hypothetical protein
MNTTEQAKNGFKTFILTFSISVLVFGAFYYLVSASTASDVDIEKSNVMGVTSIDDTGSTVSEGTTSSPFEELVRNTPDVQPAAVLSGADEGAPLGGPLDDGSTSQTTQSTVPETGMVGMTVAFSFSVMLLGLFAYIIFINPRKYALSKFEKSMSEDLD